MKLIRGALERWPDYLRLEEAVQQGKTPAAVTGLSGIHKCCLIASLIQKTGRRALVLAADEAEAQRFCEDLFALGVSSAAYPLRDFTFRDAAGTSHEYERLRLEALAKLKPGETSDIIEMGEWRAIVRKVAERAGEPTSLAEAWPKVEAAVRAELGQARYNEWVDSLRKNAYIKNVDVKL